MMTSVVRSYVRYDVHKFEGIIGAGDLMAILFKTPFIPMAHIKNLQVA